MSYTIEYNRVFLKSDEGITPCILMGSSNCYEPRYSLRGVERRERSWGCFLNMIGVTEDDLMAVITPWLGGHQEHWKKKGQWIDDAGLIRWVKSGIKNAVCLEDLLRANNLTSVRASVYTWAPDVCRQDQFVVNCSTTAELDAWIQRAKAMITVNDKKGIKSYPVIEGLPEDVRLPRKRTADNVLIKKKNMYLNSYTSNSVRWTRNIADAIVVSFDEAEQLMHHTLLFGGCRLVDAKRKDAPNNAVLRFQNGSRAGYYVACRTRSRIRLSYDVDGALHYTDKKTAETAMAKIQPVVRSYGELEVVTL